MKQHNNQLFTMPNIKICTGRVYDSVYCNGYFVGYWDSYNNRFISK